MHCTILNKNSGDVALSASSGLSTSDLHLYQKPTEHGTFTPSYGDGSLSMSIPLYYMDSDSLISTTRLLPKSEGIIFADGQFQLIFESDSNQFLY